MMNRLFEDLRALRRLFAGLLMIVALAGCQHKQNWHLKNVTHIVAPLQFSMQSTAGGTATAKDFRGKLVMLYFGYTHCPDVCPTTLAKLSSAIGQLGPQSKDVRVLFVTVDPKRDDIKTLTAYVDAFDPKHFVGLRGNVAATEAIAKRYRVAYSYEKPDASGNYAVNHSAAVFIFGRHGNARLLGTEATPTKDFVADLKQLLSD